MPMATGNSTARLSKSPTPGKTTGTGTQEEVTNFEVKIRIDDHDVGLRPGLSCTADIETEHGEGRRRGADAERDHPHRRQQSEPGRNRKEKAESRRARTKATTTPRSTNERHEKQTQKEEREKLQKVVFLKDGGKAKMVKVTTGIADDTYMEIKSGIQAGRRSDLRQLQRDQPQTERRREGGDRQGRKK